MAAPSAEAVRLIDQAIQAVDKLLASQPGAKAAVAAVAATTTPAATAPAPKPAELEAKPTVTAADSNGAPKQKKAAAAAAPAKPTAATTSEAKPESASPAPKKTAPAAPGGAAAAADPLALFSKVLIKVARVLTVVPVDNSDKLYKLTVDVGGGEIRQVCAGLRQFLTPEQLQGALVAAVCNLKPAKLAGNLSEAMLLAAEVEAPDAPGGLLVRTLLPPAGSEPGEQVFLQGGQISSETIKQLKSDHWKVVAGVLRVAGGRKATVDGTPLVTAKGDITLPPEISDGAFIH